MSVFGTWLQGQIDARGWDQRLAAQHIGVAETSIHNWIHQEITPGVRNLLKISRGLQVPIELVLQQAGYDAVFGVAATPDAVAQQRAAVLAALPQFADIIDVLAQKSPERQAAYLEMIRRLLIDPESNQ